MEIGFEYLASAREVVRGTAVTPPTKRWGLAGTLVPKRTSYKAPNRAGQLSAIRRKAIVNKWGELEAEGDLDIKLMPWVAQMVLNGSVSLPTTPVNAVNTRLFTFPRTLTADNLKTDTFYWGDPNHPKMWQGAFGALSELSFGSTPTGEDGAMMSVKGQTNFPSQVNPPTAPAVQDGPLIIPGWVQVWADTSLAIGTTEIVGRVLDAQHTIPNGVTFKKPAQGPASGLSYSRLGRVPTTPTTTLSLDMVDQDEYDLYEGAEEVKLRVRHNGPLIELEGGTSFYYYVQVDMWGTLDELEWGEYEGNRTLDLTLEAEPDATAGTDCILYVQTTDTTIE